MHAILGLLFGILILVDVLKLKQANPHVAVEEVFINGFCSEEHKRPYYYIHVVCVRLLGIPKDLTLYEGSHCPSS